MNRNSRRRRGLRRSLRGRRRGCRRRLRTVPVKDRLHVVRIGATVDDIIVRRSCLPEHNTTEGLRILVHVLGNQGLNFGRVQVESLNGHVRTGRQTDKQFRVRVGAVLDNSYPFIVVESRVAIALHKVPGRASFSIVKLHPDEIEHSVGNGVAQLSIGDRALRCT